MPFYDLFSVRSKTKKSSAYEYDTLPQEFRNSVAHIIVKSAGRSIEQYYSREPISNRIYRRSTQILCEEKGLLSLSQHQTDSVKGFLEYLLNAKSIDTLDAIEIFFKILLEERAPSPERISNSSGRPIFLLDDGISVVNFEISAKEAVEELNRRFRQYNLGYLYDSQEGLRKLSSEVADSEIVAPALLLLREKQFEGANEEFSKALDHLRHGRHRETVQFAGCALESTLKAICDKRNWKYDKRAQCKNLIDLIVEKKLIPEATLQQLTSLRAILESSVPTVRNNHGAHGAGSKPMDVPAYVANFIVHCCAANIILLAEADKAKK